MIPQKLAGHARHILEPPSITCGVVNTDQHCEKVNQSESESEFNHFSNLPIPLATIGTSMSTAFSVTFATPTPRV